MRLLRIFLRPFGYLAFVLALAALSATESLLGSDHELGFFARRLSEMLWQYPEVTRRGVQTAWGMWAVLFCLALSPWDPLSSRWDEVALALLALYVLLRRRSGVRRAAHLGS